MRVLVVEDDYLLAWDTCNALSGAGAEIVEPVANETDALEAIQRGNLHVAVTDINLGRGPSYKTARVLTHDGIPFVFTTGYDQLPYRQNLRKSHDSSSHSTQDER